MNSAQIARDRVRLSSRGGSERPRSVHPCVLAGASLSPLSKGGIVGPNSFTDHRTCARLDLGSSAAHKADALRPMGSLGLWRLLDGTRAPSSNAPAVSAT